ncbi:tyrosine-protein kinase domain-containing protein [Desertimonas flava]|uniref:tyrosine-protein kinase domain-containing protein n=1 Tax=Desertimonas flava TaxID=2064846 RepID=UPI000E351715|nr:tyrosine-protein kinase domain-containing protein [Desertimonas flava]
MSERRELTLRDYARVVWRRKWIVLAALIMALGGSLVMSILQDPIYEAESQMFVEPRSSAAVFEQDQTLAVPNLERAIQTEIQVLEGQMVRNRVQTDLGLDNLPPTASARSLGGTDVVAVSVRSGDPRTAQFVADAYIQAYIETRREQAIDSLDTTGAELQTKIDELQVQIDGAEAGSAERQSLLNRQNTFKERLDQLEVDAALTTGGASVVKEADLPTDPVEPRPLRSAVLAAFVGLLLGLGAAFLIDYLDDSLRRAEDVEASTGLPVLGVVPIEPPPDNRPIAISEPYEFAVEVYRGLRSSIQFLGLDKPLKTIQVTSSLPGEGKTTTATNLAVVLAQAGHHVVLIDADLRKPRVHEVFSIPVRPGLTETLVAGEAVDMVLVDFDRLRVIAAGSLVPNPSEMLSSSRFKSLVRQLAERYDYVVIDSPPALPVSDALAVSNSVDGVLVVGQAGRTSNRTLESCLAKLEQVGAPVFGLVLNKASARVSEGYGYDYAYGYDNAPEAATTRRNGRRSPAPQELQPPVESSTTAGESQS